MTDEPRQILVTDPEAWAGHEMRSVERVGPRGPMWVHAYTLAEFSQIKRLAGRMANAGPDKSPPREALMLAQMVWVCRVEAGSDLRVFRMEAGKERESYLALLDIMPGPWVETVCAESDSLCMAGYIPAKSEKPGHAAAKRNLHEALTDPRVWQALEVLSLKVYGLPLTDNGQPIASVLAAFDASKTASDQLVSALGALTGA